MSNNLLDVYLNLEHQLDLEKMLIDRLELHYFDSLLTFKKHYFIKEDELIDFLNLYNLTSLLEVTDFIIFYSPASDEFIHLTADKALAYFTNSVEYHIYLKKAD